MTRAFVELTHRDQRVKESFEPIQINGLVQQVHALGQAAGALLATVMPLMVNTLRVMLAVPVAWLVML